MKFSEDKVDQGYHITAYEQGLVMVSGSPKTGSFIISLEQLIEDDHADVGKPDLVLIGTGERLKFPAMEHYASLIQRNIGVEIMDSAAACRTYNILLSEGRKVVAGIIIESGER